MVSAREELERVEKDGGESERPIVSLKRGTIPRDPVERRGRHVMTPLEGNMAGASKPITVSMKQQRSRRRVRDGALIHSGSPRGAIPWGHPARNSRSRHSTIQGTHRLEKNLGPLKHKGCRSGD